MKKEIILFVHPGASSFVREDLKILRSEFEVKDFHFRIDKPDLALLGAIYYLFRILKQFIWLLLNAPRCTVIFCWFSDFHSFLPAVFSRIFNKPLLVVNGGYDAVGNQELAYGIFRDTWQRPFGEYVLKNTDLLLPVSRTLIESDPISKNWGEAYPNGIKYHIPGLKTEWEELPTGYDPDIWPPGPANREPVVLTVAYINSMRTAMIKGIDLFIESAKLLPEFTFRIIGVTDDMKQSLISTYDPPSNVDMIPSQKREDLSAFYQQASVYAQLSRSEGLPNVLCEAMMSECIPLGSSVFGIPEAIGDTGYVIEYPEPTDIASSIRKAHSASENKRSKPRKRIKDHYSLDLRKARLLRILNRYVGRPKLTP